MARNKKRLSIKDISKELNISTTTISLVINNKAKDQISDKVIRKVKDYVEKVGYKPNSSAQSLRTGRSKSIVFMVEDISDPFFAAVSREMEIIALENDYNMILCSTENKRRKTLELIDFFKERQVDAFIITPPEDFEKDIERMVCQEKEAVMLFDRYYESFDHNYVVLNNKESSMLATEALYKNGCRNLAFVGIDTELSALVHRYLGFTNVIEQYNLKNSSLFLSFEKMKSPESKSIIEGFIKENQNIDGVLFASNNLAINGLRAIEGLDLKIPSDISVISFDDRDVFELHSPPISVISQPIAELAEELIEGTFSILNEKSKEKNDLHKVLNGRLINRCSIKA